MSDYYLIQWCIGTSICITGITLFVIQAFIINNWLTANIITLLLGICLSICTVEIQQERKEKGITLLTKGDLENG